MTQYKPSMFNRILFDDDRMILFNARTGSRGIRTVMKLEQNDVISWLNQQSDYSENETFRKLIECGFIVPADYDEKAIQRLFYDWLYRGCAVAFSYTHF